MLPLIDGKCPCCGQPVPDLAPLGVPLTPLQERLVAEVRRAGEHGIESTVLMDRLYADCPHGGPDDATGQRLKATVYWTNRRLAAIGKEVRSSGGGGSWGYRGRYYFRDKGKRYGRAP